MLRESQLRADHPSVATNLNNLALFYEAQEKYDEAETLAKRALAIRQTVLGDEHLDTLNSLLTVKGLQIMGLLQCDKQTLIELLQALTQANNLPVLNTEIMLMLPDLIASDREATQSLREALQSQTEAT